MTSGFGPLELSSILSGGTKITVINIIKMEVIENYKNNRNMSGHRLIK